MAWIRCRPSRSGRLQRTRRCARTPLSWYVVWKLTRPRSMPGSAECLAPGWTLPRIPRVDRNVLRIAVFEIDYGEVPDAVAVTEAVQLVSELSTDESPAFVNGLLRAITAGDVRRTTF